MTRVISAFEAPALLDAHPSLTRYALYERLTGAPDPKGRIGLASCLADGAMRFAQEEYSWSSPVSRPFERVMEGGLTARARAYVTTDQEGPLLVVFLHLADYLHRLSWNKAGVPPLAFQIQANWIMWLADAPRMSFLVLTDKRLVLYEVTRDQALIDRLAKAVDDMAAAIDTNSPPPIDAEPVPETSTAPIEPDTEPADLDELVQRWRAATAVKAETANAATFADHAAEAATEVLKSALPKGAHHEFDGLRVHHNAKSGRLTEEKIDGKYF